MAFLLFSCLRYITQCLQLPKGSFILNAARVGYMPVLVMHLLFYSVYIGILFTWSILAAVLDPAKFLPCASPFPVRFRH